MKRRLAAILLVAAAALTFAIYAAVAETKAAPKTTTVTGEVVDLWCYMDHNARGAAHKACGTACAKNGNPVGLVDAKNNVYVLVNSENHGASRDNLINHMADTVTATGTLASKGGTQVLYVTSVK